MLNASRHLFIILNFMKVIFDLELHSKYARAVSKDMVPERIAEWCAKKGINVAGTGDFTHPQWFSGLKESLEPAEEGLFKLRKAASPKSAAIRFLLQGEISCIYSKKGKVRRVHQLVYAPSFEVAEKINKRLAWIGNLRSDGRPVIGIDSKELLKIMLDASSESYMIPAHCWTPWFGIFGSKSGFDSLQDAFDEMTNYIFAIETGLSSDPPMNWRIPFLDEKAIVSGSDAHSLQKIGREATVVDVDLLSYKNIFDAIKSRDPKKFLFTIEFFPEEGKYHFDGHRDARHSQSPEDTKKAGGRCKACGNSITVGVMSRVQELASPDRPEGYSPPGKVPFKKLVPLQEIIAEAQHVGVSSKSVQELYQKLTEELENEFFVLLEASRDQIRDVSGSIRVAEAVMRVREENLHIEPGYDGEFGKIKIFEEGEKVEEAQGSLF